MGYVFSIEYKKGIKSKIVDALPRQFDNAKNSTRDNCNLVSHVRPKWVEKITRRYDTNTEMQELISKVTLHPQDAADYSCLEGLLGYKGRQVIAKSHGV